MKARNLILPASALAGAAMLLAPEQSQGFTTIGGNLSTLQRDFRVFDNFTDAASNDNVTPHAQFPGYTGAEMAIWKSLVEWGSGLHGDGTGDATQGQLGDGGANFDPSWQGNATSTGNSNSNVNSTISSCGGGTLAFTETPISDGWRIRFCDEWVWHDGPVAISGGGSSFDIQGVATHEHGHALGLGHSGTANATMAPSTGPGAIGTRSIHSDDIAGVQFIYGVASVTKPVITSITGGATITITGTNFAATGNEVWFTQAATGGTGDPIKVLGVASSAGGTMITVGVPVSAGSGDILVKKSAAGTTGDLLSNAFPFDVTATGPEIFCTGKTTSAGCVPFISTSGTPAFSSALPFNVFGNDHIEGEVGLYLYSTVGKGALDFHGGKLCVKAPFVRLNSLVKETDAIPCTSCPGNCRMFKRNFNELIQGGFDPALTVGANVSVQVRQRDATEPLGFGDNLTNGVSFVIGP